MNNFYKILKILDIKDKKNLVFLFVIILLTTFLELLNVASFVALANIILNEDKIFRILENYPYLEKFFLEKDYSYVVFIFVVVALVILSFKAIILIFFFWVKNRFLFLYEVKLRDRLYKKYFKQNYSFFLKNDQSDLIRNINTEVGNFRFVALQVPAQIVLEFLIIFFIFSSLIYIKPLETISLVLIFSTLVTLYYLLIKNYLKRWSKKRLETESKIIKNLVEAFSMIKEIIVYKRSNYFIKKNYNDNFRLSNINVINYFVAEIPRHLLEFCGFFLILVYLYIMMEYQNKNLEEIIFTLTLFSISIYKILPSYLKVINGFQSLKYGSPVIDIIFNDINLVEKNSLTNDTTSKIKFERELKLENINLNYEGKLLYKESLNLIVKKNEKVLIVGKSGSGKTSLLLMLAGLINPAEGKIFTDGKNILSNLDSWQNKIAWVDQKTILFDDTIKNNITIYEDNNEFKVDKFNHAIKLSNLEDMLETEKNNISERKIGENNKKISGGEAQRIALARAFYKNRDILLLDEFTSNLDQNNTISILEKLKDYSDKTIIAVSHDESISKFFDRRIII